MNHRAVLALVLVACGGGGTTQLRDSGADDDALDPDATITDAPGSTLRVEARSVDGPLAGVEVAFLDAADLPLLVVTTGTDGQAIGPAGSSVVAASPAGDRAFLWRGVKPGDVLHARYDVTTAMHDVTFTLPLAPDGGTYRIYTRCGKNLNFSASRIIVVSLPISCSASDVIAQHFGVFGAWDEVLLVPAQSLTAASIDLTALAWAATTPYTVVANNVTANAAQLISDVRIGDVFASGLFFSQSGQAPVGTVSTTARAINATGAEINARLVTMSGTVQLTSLYRGTPPSPAFDGGSRVVSLAAPTYNATTRTLTWGQGTVGDPPDAVRGTITFNRPGLPALTWEIISPAVTPTSVKIPALPAALADVDPGATAAATRRVRGYAMPGGYDRARAAMFGTVTPDELLTGAALLRMADSTPP